MAITIFDLKFNGFDWDESNSGKVVHRIPLEYVEELFQNEPLTMEDQRHSVSEARFIAMGEVKKRILFVAYTLRKKGEETLIRVISARYIHSTGKEKEFYEQAKKIFKKS